MTESRPRTFLTAMLVVRLLIAVGVMGLWGNIAAADQKPLKVFILVGQSNMQGHAHVRTFEHIGMDPATAPLLDQMQDDAGAPRVCENVWISYLSAGGEKHGRLTTGFGADENKIGPELTFGIHMQKMLNEPILIIKAAWGGKSLHTDFRPPSAGPYEFKQAQLQRFNKQGKDVDAIKAEKVKTTGHYYRLTIDHMKSVLADIQRVYPHYDADQGFELAGFVWFQGWNDKVDRGTYPDRDRPGGYDEYTRLLVHFIRDVRRDLSAPRLPFVIGVMGVGGPVEKYPPRQQRYKAIDQHFRMAMAAPADLPQFKGNVAAVLTEKFWDLQLSELTARDADLRKKLNQLQAGKKLSRVESQAALEKLRAQEFTASELRTLEMGVSNQAYHYLGSAKIMAQIGEAFAAALAQIQSK